jgi:thiamine-phosphate pyrophosphorylase
MPGSNARLFLISPVLAEAEAFAPLLKAACAGGGIAAVLLRLAPADERTLVNQVKQLAPLAQEVDAAVVIAAEAEADLATVAGRGGADGIHVSAQHDLRLLRDRLTGDRILGVGRIRARHEAMEAGEAGADYLMFGEPAPDGWRPGLDEVVERAAWWAEIFETPCVAASPSMGELARLAETGAEFLALDASIWDDVEGPAAAVAKARAALAAMQGADP